MSGGELAGLLRERIMIERRDDARDTLAGADGAWSVVATRWAAVNADGAGDAVVGEVASAAARYKITLRAGAPVRFGDRIGWRGATLRVRAITAWPDRIVLAAEEMR